MTTYIQQRFIGTHSFSVQFQVNLSSCFNFSSQLYDIHFVTIYLNILKYIKKSIFLSNVIICCCCLMSFELSAFSNCVIYICRNVSLSLCVLCLPLHIVMHLFSVHFICHNLKNTLCVCKCVCVII